MNMLLPPNTNLAGANMSKKKEEFSKDDIILFPELSKYAQNADESVIYESIEDTIDSVNQFLQTNKKADFDNAKKQLEYTVACIRGASKAGVFNTQGAVDIIHDAMLLPLYIMRYTAEKNGIEILEE